MAGRKPTPTNIRILKGNPGHRPLPENEPVPETCIPSPPDHLDGESLKEWKRITSELHTLGLLSNIDSTALAAYCQCYGRWVEAEKGIKESGLMVKTTNGNIIQSPLVGVANKAMLMMHKFLVEFGMTPSSRTKVSAIKKEPEKKGFAALNG